MNWHLVNFIRSCSKSCYYRILCIAPANTLTLKWRMQLLCRTFVWNECHNSQTKFRYVQKTKLNRTTVRLVTKSPERFAVIHVSLLEIFGICTTCDARSHSTILSHSVQGIRFSFFSTTISRQIDICPIEFGGQIVTNTSVSSLRFLSNGPLVTFRPLSNQTGQSDE